MFQASQIKHSYATISATAHKNINAMRAKPNVKDLFVMRDKLGLGSQRRNIPNGTSGVDTGRYDETWGEGIPV